MKLQENVHKLFILTVVSTDFLGFLCILVVEGWLTQYFIVFDFLPLSFNLNSLGLYAPRELESLKDGPSMPKNNNVVKPFELPN